MAADWIVGVVSGASGVGGALIGTGGTLWVSRREASARREQERREALVGFYVATNRFGHFYASYHDLMPANANLVVSWRNKVALNPQGSLLVARLFGILDQFWEASARLLVLASSEERQVVREIENVIAEWAIGTPLPEAWGPAIRRLRALVEAEDGAPPGKRGSRVRGYELST